jgi:hypothetical protein
MAIWAVSLATDGASPPWSDSRVLDLPVFGVWLASVGLLHLTPFSALPLEGTLEASPKAISRRTSYYGTRLEFLRYPQLIPACCTARGFGPPVGLTQPSPWPWIDRPVSGLVPTVNERPLRLAFAMHALPQEIIRTIENKLVGSFFNRNAVTHPKTGSDSIVRTQFQILFHHPSGLLFTFPSRYWFTIGYQMYLAFDL